MTANSCSTRSTSVNCRRTFPDCKMKNMFGVKLEKSSDEYLKCSLDINDSLAPVSAKWKVNDE